MTTITTVRDIIKKLSKETIDPNSQVVFQHESGIYEWDHSINCVADRVVIIKLKKMEATNANDQKRTS